MLFTKPPHQRTLPDGHQPGQISLAVVIASAITLAMLTLTVVLISQSFRGMEQAKITAAEAMAGQLATSVDDRIHAVTQPPATALTALRHDPLAGAANLDQRLDRLQPVAEVLNTSDIINAIYAGYGNGDFFLLRDLAHEDSERFADAPPDSRYLLQSVERSGQQVRGTWLFYDQALNLLRRQDLPDYRFDPRQRPWYQQAQQQDTMQLSSPYTFFTTRQTGLTLAWKAAGLPETVLGIDVTVTDLGAKLSELKQTPGSRIAIVNRTGEVLASSEDQSDSLPGPLIRQALAQPTQQVQNADFGQRDWYTITADLSSLPDEQLTIAIAIPADELLADVWDALTRQTLIAIAIAGLLLVVGWLLGRQVGKPLTQLTDRVSRLSRFRFDTPVRSDSHIREASELSIALDDMAHTIRSFQNISTTLNRGQDLNELLKEVLEQIISILGQRRGAVYLFSRQARQLDLAVNQQMQLPETLDDIGPDCEDSELIRRLRISIDGHPVFSVLRNRENQLIGVLVVEMELGRQTDLSDDLIVFVNEIAGSAAVAIETRELIESQQALLEGIIRLVANAIDAKSPYTGGHCERVPKLAQMLVEKAESSTDAPFADFAMSEQERYEFHLAAWLHDCGKITTPEFVVDKSVKLETIHNRLHEIRTRFEVLYRDTQIHYLQSRLAGQEAETAADQRDRVLNELQQDFAFLAQCNQGTEAMSDEDIERIRRIGERTWQRHFSDRLGLSEDERQAVEGIPEPELPVTERLLADKPDHLRAWGAHVPPVDRNDPANRWGFDMELPDNAYNHGELHNLCIRRGTLNPEERFRIQEHIVQTICMLDALPLPDRLANVPRLAGTHHERMDGQGYPCKLTGEEMGTVERIMAVADVFEALTAVDRPYKRGKTLSESLQLMAGMVENGHLDREVFKLFVHSGAYREYADKHMKPRQIDTVDESRFMNL